MAKPAESNPHTVDADAHKRPLPKGAEANTSKGTHNPTSKGK